MLRNARGDLRCLSKSGQMEPTRDSGSRPIPAWSACRRISSGHSFFTPTTSSSRIGFLSTATRWFAVRTMSVPYALATTAGIPIPAGSSRVRNTRTVVAFSYQGQERQCWVLSIADAGGTYPVARSVHEHSFKFAVLNQTYRMPPIGSGSFAALQRAFPSYTCRGRLCSIDSMCVQCPLTPFAGLKICKKLYGSLVLIETKDIWHPSSTDGRYGRCFISSRGVRSCGPCDAT
jgi:hypothetical protein